LLVAAASARMTLKPVIHSLSAPGGLKSIG